VQVALMEELDLLERLALGPEHKPRKYCSIKMVAMQP
jgi:hypothetical protein